MRFVIGSIGMLFMASALVVAGFSMLPQPYMNDERAKQLRLWGVGIAITGFLILVVSLVNWGIYHPSNVHLPFVNDR